MDKFLLSKIITGSVAGLASIIYFVVNFVVSKLRVFNIISCSIAGIAIIGFIVIYLIERKSK